MDNDAMNDFQDAQEDHRHDGDEDHDNLDDDNNGDDVEEEEDEESYRRRVYGTTEYHDRDTHCHFHNNSSVGRTNHLRSKASSLSSSSSSLRPSLRLSSSSSNNNHQRRSRSRRPSSFRRLSRKLSDQSTQLLRRSSSILQDKVMPETPAGWTVATMTLLSAILGYETNLQHQLTQPPAVFYQRSTSLSSKSSPSSQSTNSFMDRLYEKMTVNTDDDTSSSSSGGGNTTTTNVNNNSDNNNNSKDQKILSRNIQPSLFVGTRGIVSSTAAYLMGGGTQSTNSVRFREIMKMSQDLAEIAIDWEVVPSTSSLMSQHQENMVCANNDSIDATNMIRHQILHGPIDRPVVIVLHGINNDASFGYMKSLSRTYSNRGYAVACMNFRGAGHVPMTTPRGYNGAYTGDIRNVVYQISSRMMKMTKKKISKTDDDKLDGDGKNSRSIQQQDETPPIFLVGNSLGANILTKYLGEEGAAGTLPSCVAGAASLGNPLLIDSSIVKFPFNILMGLGVKKIYLENWKSVTGMADFHSKHCLRTGLLSSTIAAFDHATAPMFIRNNNKYPFNVKIGYEDGNEYWFDASSYRYLSSISVPFLSLTARDDFLVSKPSRNKLGFCLSNPNVMVVETRCGGHLGWQESPPDSSYGSYADACTSEFFDAIIQANAESTPQERQQRIESRKVDAIRYMDTVVDCITDVTPKTVCRPSDEELARIKTEAIEFSNNHLTAKL